MRERHIKFDKNIMQVTFENEYGIIDSIPIRRFLRHAKFIEREFLYLNKIKDN